MQVAINYGAVVVASVAAFLAGWLWHGPLFGKQWARLVGMSMNGPKGGMGKAMAWGFVNVLVTSWVLAHFVGWLSVATVGGAFALAFWVTLGFTGTSMANRVIWEHAPFKLLLLNAGGSLLSLFVTAWVLAVWR